MRLRRRKPGDGVTLDEYLATVCRLRNVKIIEIETFLSDVAGMDAFFTEDRRDRFKAPRTDTIAARGRPVRLGKTTAVG